MKKNFKTTEEEIEDNKKKKYHKSMASLAMSCLLGVGTTALGISASIEANYPMDALLATGGILTCTSIAALIREKVRYKKQQKEEGQGEKVR